MSAVIDEANKGAEQTSVWWGLIPPPPPAPHIQPRIKCNHFLFFAFVKQGTLSIHTSVGHWSATEGRDEANKCGWDDVSLSQPG